MCDITDFVVVNGVSNMSKRKTALVTGASGELGLEFARLLAKKHYDLVAVARNGGKLNGIRSELEKEHGITVWVYPCDLSKVDAAHVLYDATTAAGYTVSALVNNAGFGDHVAFSAGPYMSIYTV